MATPSLKRSYASVNPLYSNASEQISYNNNYVLPLSYGRLGIIAAVAEFFGIILVSLISVAIYSLATRDYLIYYQSCIGLGISSALAYVLAMQAQHYYRTAAVLAPGRLLGNIVWTWTGVFVVLIGIAFFAKITVDISRLSAICVFVGGIAILPTIRFSLQRLLKYMLATGRLGGQTRVVLFGEVQGLSSSDIAIRLRGFGYNIVGQFTARLIKGNGQNFYGDIVSSIADIKRFVAENQVDQIFLCFDSTQRRTIDIVSHSLKVIPVPVRLLFDDHLNSLVSREVEDLGATQAVKLQDGPLTRYQQFAKRTVDVVLSLLGLIALAPFLVLIAVIIRIDSPGPALFRQRRAGFSGRRFMIYKFRSMRVMDDGENIRQATVGDSRVTRVGRFIRKTSIDELPQLLNVLKGDMSLVGPRPHAISHDNQYEKLIATYAFRNHVKPGITGWAQVNGYRGETAELIMMQQRVDHDIFYVGHCSLWFDFKIIGLTVLQVLKPGNVY